MKKQTNENVQPLYPVGSPCLFKVGIDTLDIGEVVGIKKSKKGFRYHIRVATEHPTPDGFIHYLVPEERIVNPRITNKPLKFEDWASEWLIAHIDEINEAFGFDVRNYALITVYDSFEKVKDDFGEYALDKNICQQVLDKWIFIM